MQKITRVFALLLVAAAIVLAVVALGLKPRAAAPAPTTASAVPPTASASKQSGQPVVVAAIALRAGAPIASDALRVDMWPQHPAGGFADAESLRGEVAAQDIPAGMAITSALLARGIAVQLQPGERALAVPVDELAGAGNRIMPGDFVDVFLSLKTTRPGTTGLGNSEDTQTRLLLSRLRVLAYGSLDLPPSPSQNSPPASNGTDANKSANNSNPQPARTAVLAVPVGYTDRLLLGAQNGKLSLALRHPGDVGLPDIELFPQPRSVLSPRGDLASEQRSLLQSPENRAYAGIDMGGLAGQTAARPAPRGGGGLSGRGLEIIRGTQRDELSATRTPSP